MKRALFVIAMSGFGSVIGWMTSLLLTAFIPACGDVCSRERIENLVLCFVGGIGILAIYSFFLSRRSIPSIKQSLLGCLVIGALILVPAFAHYVHELRTEYCMLRAIAPVQPTTDFFHMTISTRVVQGFTDASYGPAKPLTIISPWERCLIGSIRCGSSPRQVEMLCKAGVVHVNEADWPAFSLIPSENAHGVAPLKSMHLCDN